MSFLYPVNLEKCLNIAVAGTFIALAIIFFQDAQFFSYIFYAFLIFSAYLCRRQHSLLLIILAVFLTNIASEIFWYFLIYFDSKLFLAGVYLALGISIYYLADINGNKYLFRLLWLLMVGAELYWYFTGYNSPIIYPYLLYAVLALILQWFLVFRVILLEKHKYQMSHISLDRLLSHVAQLKIIICVCMIAEYLVRHLTPYQPMFIYDSYEYVVHILFVSSVFLIFNTSYKQWLPRKLTA